MTAWHDDDRFWAETAPVVFTEQRWKGAASDVEGVVQLLGLNGAEAVLDLGCGPGRHSIEFAQRGFRVTGVDRTSAYLAEAKRRAEQVGVKAEWVHADMREFRREGAFDVAVNLLSSFGYFDDPEDDRRVVGNVFASLRPGGRFVIDLMGKEVLARIFRKSDWHQEPDGTILMEERTIWDDWSRLSVRWVIIREERRVEQTFILRLFSAVELKELLTSVGFTDRKAYGSLAGKPFDHEAERLVVVGRKP